MTTEEGIKVVLRDLLYLDSVLAKTKRHLIEIKSELFPFNRELVLTISNMVLQNQSQIYSVRVIITNTNLKII